MTELDFYPDTRRCGTPAEFFAQVARDLGLQGLTFRVGEGVTQAVAEGRSGRGCEVAMGAGERMFMTSFWEGETRMADVWTPDEARFVRILHAALVEGLEVFALGAAWPEVVPTEEARALRREDQAERDPG